MTGRRRVGRRGDLTEAGGHYRLVGRHELSSLGGLHAGYLFQRCGGGGGDGLDVTRNQHHHQITAAAVVACQTPTRG